MGLHSLLSWTEQVVKFYQYADKASYSVKMDSDNLESQMFRFRHILIYNLLAISFNRWNLNEYQVQVSKFAYSVAFKIS